ncbi:hypothetical protein [Thermomonas alba]|uniref:hypothetical protein n=1 Tax=Thermomonas alba TaxID=2888525 RepID=UPI001F0472B9|nr:hypothetical protein [Thermomonas alba]
MSALFQLSAPWWVFVLRALVVYVLVMVLMRLSGKRSVGQFTPFDLVLLVLLGNSVQNGINGGDNSLTGAAIMASTLIAVNSLVALATARSRLAEHLLETNGHITILRNTPQATDDRKHSGPGCAGPLERSE